MRLGVFDFRPRWGLSVATLIALAILLRLGFWQLERADEKRAILAKQEQVRDMPPADLNRLDSYKALKDQPYRKVRATGRFDAQRQILIDNKIHQGRVGFEVVTPLLLQGSQRVVLVNRGWRPMGPTREDLPATPTPEQTVTVEGMLKVNLKDVISISDTNRVNQGWPAIVQWVDIEGLRASTGMNLLPFMIFQAPQDAHGFVRDWRIVNATPARHVSYAVQWFVIAAALLIVYLIMSTHKVKHDEHT